MPGPVVTIKCSQCAFVGHIRQRDIKRLKDKDKWLCPDCRKLSENNANWQGGISLDRGRYSAEMRRRHPEHYRARRLAERARRSGKLVPQPCEACGDPNVEMHHDNYGEPLRVRWLCQKDHDIADAEKKAREHDRT